jgi:hypothetical protein
MVLTAALVGIARIRSGITLYRALTTYVTNSGEVVSFHGRQITRLTVLSFDLFS